MEPQPQPQPPQQDPHKRKIAIALIASLATVALVLIGAHFLRPSSDPSFTGVTDADVEAGMTEAPPEDGTPLPPPAAIDFKDVLVLMDHSYSVDGGAMTDAVCSETDPPFTFATIRIGESKVAELTCLNDYLGGISMKAASEPPLYEKLGLQFGDAGEMSDKRAWVRRSPEGLTIVTVSRWSQEDMDEEESSTHVECGSKMEQLVISGKDLSFTKSEFKGKLEDYVFNPPPNINSKCQ
ncbi:MAG: hypothetical protein V4760_15610 [Bdellovibrionota bacterium]